MVRWAALALVVLTVGLGAAACGDDEGSGGGTTTTEETTTTETTTTDTTTTDTTTETETTETETTTAAGREVFLANCGSCHTFSDAGTTGTIGPNLDEIALSTEQVAEQVRNGGAGMPAFADQLSEDEIEQVAAYVAGSGGS